MVTASALRAQIKRQDAARRLAVKGLPSTKARAVKTQTVSRLRVRKIKLRA